MKATHKASQGSLKGVRVSAQKALQGSKTETKELLGGMEEKNEGSLIFPSDKSIIFIHEKEKEQNSVSGQTCIPKVRRTLVTSVLRGRSSELTFKTGAICRS